MSQVETISYNGLIAEISKLQKQAEFLRKEQVQNVIQNINKQMKDYGLSMNDLSVESMKNTSEVEKPHKKVEAKFKDPVSGVTWSGRGKTPKWIVASGKPKEHFAIAA